MSITITPTLLTAITETMARGHVVSLSESSRCGNSHTTVLLDIGIAPANRHSPREHCTVSYTSSYGCKLHEFSILAPYDVQDFFFTHSLAGTLDKLEDHLKTRGEKL